MPSYGTPGPGLISSRLLSLHNPDQTFILCSNFFCRKSCSTKSKSVNGASALSPTSQQLSLGRDLPMSSLSQSSSIYNKTSAAKRKPSGDKKKKVTKRASTEFADHSTKSSPPYSHRVSNESSYYKPSYDLGNHTRLCNGALL